MIFGVGRESLFRGPGEKKRMEVGWAGVRVCVNVDGVNVFLGGGGEGDPEV